MVPSARYQTRAEGGHRAVRAFCDLFGQILGSARLK